MHDAGIWDVQKKISRHLEDAFQVDVDEADLALLFNDGLHGIRACPVEVLTAGKEHKRKCCVM